MKLIKNLVLMTGLTIFGSVLSADMPKANLQLTMQTKVNPQGLALWDITNNATDDNGNLASSKLTQADWAKLLQIGKSLEDSGRTLGTSNGIIAALPGAKIQGETNTGSPTAADVQRYLNAQPAVFRSHALELQKTGAAIVSASLKHDTKRLADLANSLDEVCESCHTVFWYPNEKK